PQTPFLNAAAVGDTTLSARRLLDALMAIERERGRERPFPNAPRTLDLDLILLGDVVIDEPGLSVPHPRFRERRFVLEPLAEIAPDLVDPVTGLTIRELFDRTSRPRSNRRRRTPDPCPCACARVRPRAAARQAGAAKSFRRTTRARDARCRCPA